MKKSKETVQSFLFRYRFTKERGKKECVLIFPKEYGYVRLYFRANNLKDLQKKSLKFIRLAKAQAFLGFLVEECKFKDNGKDDHKIQTFFKRNAQ